MSKRRKPPFGSEKMSDTLTSEMTTEDAKYKAEIEKIFAELEREFEQMKLDQEEIVRLRTRTRAILDQLRTVL